MPENQSRRSKKFSGGDVVAIDNTFFYTGAFWLLLASLAFEMIALITRRRGLHWVSMWLLLAAFVFETPGLILRSLEMNFVPITNTYEAVTFVGWVGALVIFLLDRKYRLEASVGFIALAAIVAIYAISSSPIVSKEVRPPIPALQSHWLVLHVTFAFVGEVFFIVSFATAMAYLFSKKEESRQRFDELTYRSILLGFPFFTLGALVFGAIWAKYAWGRFWAWDPKETWSLITWLVYAGYLHSRYLMGWRGKKSIVFAIVGFAVMIFTFFGVNFLLAGLHSYQ